MQGEGIAENEIFAKAEKLHKQKFGFSRRSVSK
jgi:hypothetical protein